MPSCVFTPAGVCHRAGSGRVALRGWPDCESGLESGLQFFESPAYLRRAGLGPVVELSAPSPSSERSASSSPRCAASASPLRRLELHAQHRSTGVSLGAASWACGANSRSHLSERAAHPERAVRWRCEQRSWTNSWTTLLDGRARCSPLRSWLAHWQSRPRAMPVSSAHVRARSQQSRSVLRGTRPARTCRTSRELSCEALSSSFGVRSLIFGRRSLV